MTLTLKLTNVVYDTGTFGWAKSFGILLSKKLYAARFMFTILGGVGVQPNNVRKTCLACLSELILQWGAWLRLKVNPSHNSRLLDLCKQFNVMDMKMPLITNPQKLNAIIRERLERL